MEILSNGITVYELKEFLLDCPEDYNVYIKLNYYGCEKILFVHHENLLDKCFDMNKDEQIEGCTLITSYEEHENKINSNLTIKTVKDLFCHLHYFNNNLYIGFCDIKDPMYDMIVGVSTESIHGNNEEDYENSVFLLTNYYKEYTMGI